MGTKLTVYNHDKYALRVVFSAVNGTILECVPFGIEEWENYAEKHDMLDGDGTQDEFVGTVNVNGTEMMVVAAPVPFMAMRRERIGAMLSGFYGRDRVYVTINMGTGRIGYIRPQRSMRLVIVEDTEMLRED